MTTATELETPKEVRSEDALIDLLLVRLLPPTRQPPSPGKVRESLYKFFTKPLSADEFANCLQQARADGLLVERRLELTQTGRERALKYLGTATLPPRYDWRMIQARYLVPRALGLDPSAASTVKKISKLDSLAAFLLMSKFKLPTEVGASLSLALQALVCQGLGYPQERTLKGVQNRVLNRLLGSQEQLDGTRDLNVLVRLLLGSHKSGIGGLRDLVLRQFGEDKPQSAATVGEFDLPAFANTVRAVARNCQTGRFGDNKVFINHVWRHLAEEPGIAGMDLKAFKERLVQAHQADLLTLTRADLVSVMNPDDVRESETSHLTATFHFIILERGQS
jgi:hypothetical protein